jgi:uncharacterized protein (DUF2141 family)
MRVRCGNLFLAFLFAGSAWAANNPVPQLDQSLAPASALPGGPGLTLTVRGAGFVSNSVVNWNGSPRTTTFVSAGKIAASIPATDIVTAGTAMVTVKNPPPGGGVSNVAYFEVTAPTSTVTMTAYVLSQAGTLNGSASTNLAPSTFAVADFNGDGKLDIACLNGVLLGNGDGTFQAPIPFPPGVVTVSSLFFVADVNNDGKLDLVLAIPAPSEILLGNGDGSFQAPISLSGNAAGMFVGDFNGDGKPDLVTLTSFNGETLSILPGNGDGTFGAPVFSTVLPTESFVTLVAGDFNGDGKLDLAVSEPGGQNVGPLAVYLGNGDGTLQSPLVDSEATAGGLAIAVADLNGDGKLDYLTWSFNPPSPGDVTVQLGNGDGTFQSFLNAAPPAGLAVLTDLNGDGNLDLFGRPAEPGGGVQPPGIGVMLGNANGFFQTELFTAVNAGVPLSAAGSGDFNGDGKMDLLATDTQGRLWVLLQGLLPADTASPATVSFGTQSVGIPSAPQTVTLTNTGAASLTFSGISISGKDAPMFSETNTCGSSLAAGANCQVQVIFSPTLAGARSAVLNVADDGIGGPLTVPLSGNTPAVSTVVLSPTSLTFSSQLVGTSGLPQTVTLTNNGTAPFNITSVKTTPSDFGLLNACGNSLAMGASCNIGVFFDPTAGGTRTGALTVTDDAENSPQTVSLSGTGQDFSVGASGAASATITAGQTASYTIAFAPAGGFTQPIALSCGGAPAMSMCKVTPSSLQLSGTSPVMATVTVTTTAKGFVLPFGPIAPGTINYQPTPQIFALFVTFVMLVGLLLWRREQRFRCVPLFALALSVCLGMTLTSCGGGSGVSGGNTGTQAGTYTITVSGSFTSGSTTLEHTAKLTLVVQ